MADESTIRAILAADAGVVALIADRLWDQAVPSNVASPALRPYIILSVVSDVPSGYADAPPDVSEMRVQFDVYADSKASAKLVLGAMRSALHAAGYGNSEDTTQDLPADDPALRRISSDWRFVLPR